MDKVYRHNCVYLTDYKNYLYGSGNLRELQEALKPPIISDRLYRKLRFVLNKSNACVEVYSFNPAGCSNDDKKYTIL